MNKINLFQHKNLLKKNNTHIQYILAWFIIFVAIILRIYKADFYPIHNEGDPLAYAWNGISLFKNLFKPISNSIFIKEFSQSIFWRSDYNYYDTIRRFRFHLVDPFLDSPPLATLFISLPAKIIGFKDFTQIPQILIAIPALFFSVLSLLFTFILAEKLFNLKTAYLALVVYSFSPIFIFSHRQAYLENFLTPIFILTLIILYDYLIDNHKKQLIYLAIISSIGLWIKLPGFILILITSYWLIKNKKIRPFLFVFCSGLISLIVYFLYCILINKSHFFLTLMVQGNRGNDVIAFFRILTTPEFYEPFLDGIYFLGFIFTISLFYYPQDKKTNYFLTNFVFWIFLILFTTGKTNNFPWYRFPLYPFLCISTAIFINKLLKKNNFFLFFPFFILGFFGIDVLQINLPTLFIKFIYLIFLIIFVAPIFIRNNKLISKISYYFIRIFLFIVIVLNFIIIFRYPQLRCKNNNCLMPDKIIIDNP